MSTSTLKILAIAFIIAFFSFLCYQRGSTNSYFQVMPKHIENFSAINIDGGKTTYEEQKGNVTLITLSASWCPACMAEIPLLNGLYDSFSQKGFKILMINEDDNVKIAANFKKKQKIRWTMLHWNYDLMNKLGNPGVLPVTYLVNKKDSIIQINSGIFDETEMRNSIKKLLEP